MLNTPITDDRVQNLESEVIYRTRLQEIGNKINAATDLDEILTSLEEDITDLFHCDRVTIYVADNEKQELVSRIRSGSEAVARQIRVSAKSIAGFCAFKEKLVNIKDVYDDQELMNIDPGLTFDKSWDQRTGYRTKHILGCPIVFKKQLLGAVQLLNRPSDTAFTDYDERSIKELADILAIAFYNQKRIERGRIHKFSYLLENQFITQQELDKAVADARKRRVAVEEHLVNEVKIPKKDLGKSLSKYYRIPFVSYNNNVPIPGELLVGLKVPFMRNNCWVPLCMEEQKIVIAINDPHDLQKIDEIKALFPNQPVKLCVALKQDILDYVTLFTQDEKEMAAIDDIISQLKEEASEIEDAESGLGEEDSAVVQLVNKIILDAFDRGASDIHIEPYSGKQATQVRIRVDGNCHLYQTIPYNYKNALVSRIKIMSDLDIAERRKPQDGKIRFKKYGGKDIELRVATVPTQGGMEDVVMRILHSGEPIPLENMAFSKANYDNFISVITRPYGMIFVCGPTGSGKTTTLHSALRHINKVDKKIWTAEDPVEITQKGLRQVQVKPKIGFDFAAAMRAFLRADPDVIMVGEMRDKETTHIGIEASLTGHLVFSTLHTNSAPESITRLLDMGMDPFNFADAILCILAQRLVLTLCKSCKKPYHATRAEYDELVREYGPEEFKKTLNIPYTDDLQLHKGEGCAACNQTGYRGRMGIHELLMGTDDMKRKIQTKERMEVIRNQAVFDGMTTLRQDGIAKIFSGNCDLLQVRKVTIK
ncbi:MAG: GspE/PulE family protein [Desulfobacteraceae bacterium]|nr:GspE/PulE family protein [Desulfobacteraceae bacterium]